MDTTIFENQDFITKDLVGISLQNANTHWNHKHALFGHSVSIGKTNTVQVNDSTSEEQFSEIGRFLHEAGFLDQKFLFTDPLPDSLYYGFLPVTNDSLRNGTHVRKWSNKLGFQTSAGNIAGTYSALPKSVFTIYGEHSWLQVEQGAIRSLYNNLSAFVQFRSNPLRKDKLFFNLKGKYSFSGYNISDYNINLMGGIRVGKFLNLQLNANRLEQEVPWNMSTGNIESFSWSNVFKKVKTSHLSFTFDHRKWKLKIKPQLFLVNNFAYWDQFSNPTQLTDQATFFVLYVEKLFQLKQWHLDNFTVFQVGSHPSQMMKPKIITQHTFYYENVLFKGALMARIGFEVFYNTDYFAPSYSPLTGIFHQQNSSELHYYPVIDFFLSIKVKHTRIFAKYEHLSQGFFTGGYYGALNYPMADRAFKAGVSWKFLD